MNNCAFFFQGTSLLLPKGAFAAVLDLELPLAYTGKFPSFDLFTIPESVANRVYGGDFSGAIYGVSVPAEDPLPPSWQAIPVRQLISGLSGGLAEETSPAVYPPPAVRLLLAFHIAQWRLESLFCGSCGARNSDSDAELARLCPACGRIEFPRIAPAVIILITNDEGKILLAHNKKFAPGVYSLIAGFVEAGENLETTAVREVREEAGIEIGDMRYIASQPWPFPHSLMIGFSARYIGGVLKADGVEIEDAQWFSRASLPMLPGPGSLSRALIGRWLEGKI